MNAFLHCHFWLGFLAFVTVFLTTSSSIVVSLLQEGKSLIDQHRYSEAVGPLRLYMQRMPSCSQGSFLLGFALQFVDDKENERHECDLMLPPFICFTWLDDSAVAEIIGLYRVAIDSRDNLADAEVFFQLGRLLLARQSLAKDAVDLMRQAISIEASHVEATHGLAVALEVSGRTEEARVAYETNLSTKPGLRLASLLGLARVHYELGDIQAAARHCEAGLATVPSVSEGSGLAGLAVLACTIMLELARLQLALGRAVRAEFRFRRVLEQCGDSTKAVAHEGLGQALVLQGITSSAWPNGDKALRLIEDSAAQFQAAVRIEPDRVLSHMYLIRLSGWQGLWENSLVHARQAMLLVPATATDTAGTGLAVRSLSMLLLGQALLSLPDTNGSHGEAVAWLSQAASVDTSCGACHMLLASAYAATGRRKRAQKAIHNTLKDGSLASASFHMSARLSWGRLAFGEGDYRSAVWQLEQCLDLLRFQPVQPIDFGLAEDSLKLFLMGHSQAIHGAGMLATVLNNKAVSEFMRGNVSDAFELLSICVRLSSSQPGHANCYLNTATILESLGGAGSAGQAGEMWAAMAYRDFASSLATVSPLSPAWLLCESLLLTAGQAAAVTATIQGEEGAWLSWASLFIDSVRYISSLADLADSGGASPSLARPLTFSSRWRNVTDSEGQARKGAPVLPRLAWSSGVAFASLGLEGAWPDRGGSSMVEDPGVLDESPGLEAGHECVLAVAAGLDSIGLVGLARDLVREHNYADTSECIRQAVQSSLSSLSFEGSGLAVVIASLQERLDLGLLLSLEGHEESAGLIFIGAARMLEENRDIARLVPVALLSDVIRHACKAASLASLASIGDGVTEDVLKRQHNWLSIGVDGAPLSFELQFALGRNRLDAGDLVQASRHLLIAESIGLGDNAMIGMASRSDKVMLLVALGRFYESTGQVQMATMKYMTALSLDPHSIPAALAMGALLEREVDSDMSVKPAGFYLQMSTTIPDSNELRMRLGKALFRSGRLAEGLDVFREVLARPGQALSADYLEATERLVLGRRRQGRYLEALDHAMGLHRWLEGFPALRQNGLLRCGAFGVEDALPQPEGFFSQAGGIEEACARLTVEAANQLVVHLQAEAQAAVKVAEQLERARVTCDLGLGEMAATSAPDGMKSKAFTSLASLSSKCNDQDQAARGYLAALLASDPATPQLLRLELARSLTRAGDKPGAAGVYRDILRHPPGQSDSIEPGSILVHDSLAESVQSGTIAWNQARVELALLLSEAGQHKEALGLYGSWIKDDPQNGQAHLAVGLALRRAGLTDRAIAHLHSVLELPLGDEGLATLATAALAIGEMYAARGDTSLAVSFFEKAVHFQPDSQAANLALAVSTMSLYYFRKVAAQSGAECEGGETRSAPCSGPIPSFASAPELLLYGTLAEAAEAVAVLTTADSLAWGSGDDATKLAVTLALGAAQFAMGLFAEAEKAFSKALVVDPQCAVARNNRGVALFMSDRLAVRDALADLQMSSAIEEAIETRFNMIAMLLLSGSYVEAMHVLNRLDRLIQVDSAGQPGQCEKLSTLSTLQGALGLALQRFGRMDSAVDLYRKSIDSLADCLTWLPTASWPGQLSAAYKQLALILSAQGNHFAASQAALDALKADSQARPDLLGTLGLVYFHGGMYGQAKDALYEAQVLTRGSPSVHAMYLLDLAIVYYHLGETQEAKLQLEQVLQLQPDHPQALSMLQLLAANKPLLASLTSSKAFPRQARDAVLATLSLRKL